MKFEDLQDNIGFVTLDDGVHMFYTPKTTIKNKKPVLAKGYHFNVTEMFNAQIQPLLDALVKKEAIYQGLKDKYDELAENHNVLAQVKGVNQSHVVEAPDSEDTPIFSESTF